MENENNEVKVVETKKKGNGLFTLFACIMTGVIVFLATNIGQKASKVVDPDTNSGSKESNITSNVESNTTSNVPETKLSDADALKLGNELYAKAKAAAVTPLNIQKCTEISTEGSYTTYDCTALYNEAKTVFTENHNTFNNYTLKDGKYLYTAGATGAVGTDTTTLTIKTNEATIIAFTASTVSTAFDGSKSEPITSDFIIVKENGTWKVSQY